MATPTHRLTEADERIRAMGTTPCSMPISRLPSNHTAAPSLSIVGVAIASACYALVSLVCMLLLLKRIGHNAADLSTAEQADADELAREPLATPLIEDPATLPPNIDKDAQPAH